MRGLYLQLFYKFLRILISELHFISKKSNFIKTF